MPVVRGQKITAAGYNELADRVNEIFADNYPGSDPSSPLSARTSGWGNLPADLINSQEVILYALTNQLIDRLNLAAEHVGLDLELSRVSKETITAQVFNDLETVVGYVEPLKNTAAVDQLSIETFSNFSSNTPWQTSLVYELSFDFGSYDSARYYFNTASSLRLSFSKENGNTFDNLIENLYNLTGTVDFGLTETTSSTPNIISEGFGFADLTETYQLLLSVSTSGGPYGYGGYGHGTGDGGGSLAFLKIYGKVSPLGVVLLKIEITDTIAESKTASHVVSVFGKVAVDKSSNGVEFSVDSPSVYITRL